jgi:hypothetical protein
MDDHYRGNTTRDVDLPVFPLQMKIGSHLAKGQRLLPLLHDKPWSLDLEIEAIFRDLVNIY